MSVLVLDFGSQVTQLIARRVREAGVYSEIAPFTQAEAAFHRMKPRGIILSGSPASVPADGSPRAPQVLFDSGLPILGICYGAQLIAQQLGGTVGRGDGGEYGRTTMHRTEGVESELLPSGLPEAQTGWMSHFDAVTETPDGFVASAATPGAPMAVIECHDRRIYGVQYHPEVAHTPHGQDVIVRFLHGLAGIDSSWTMEKIVPMFKMRTMSSEVKQGAERYDIGQEICTYAFLQAAPPIRLGSYPVVDREGNPLDPAITAQGNEILQRLYDHVNEMIPRVYSYVQGKILIVTP
jgi:GMP synthase (glutamine-hydrolysing) A subunit